MILTTLLELVKNNSLSRHQMDHLISLVNKPEIKTCLEQIIKNIESNQILNNQALNIDKPKVIIKEIN